MKQKGPKLTWSQNLSYMFYKITTEENHGGSRSCADPQSFVGGGPTLTVILVEMRGEMIQIPQ